MRSCAISLSATCARPRSHARIQPKQSLEPTAGPPRTADSSSTNAVPSHPLAQRTSFHRRNARQQRRLFARCNRQAATQPQLQPALLRLSAMIAQYFTSYLEAASFGASEATIFSNRGSPRSGSQKGSRRGSPRCALATKIVRPLDFSSLDGPRSAVRDLTAFRFVLSHARR
jgi:hypothetical protein